MTQTPLRPRAPAKDASPREKINYLRAMAEYQKAVENPQSARKATRRLTPR